MPSRWIDHAADPVEPHLFDEDEGRNSDLEDENAIFIKSINSIKGSSARRSKSIPIGVHLNGFKVDEIIDLESNFHAVGYHF